MTKKENTSPTRAHSLRALSEIRNSSSKEILKLRRAVNEFRKLADAPRFQLAEINSRITESANILPRVDSYISAIKMHEQAIAFVPPALDQFSLPLADLAYAATRTKAALHSLSRWNNDYANLIKAATSPLALSYPGAQLDMSWFKVFNTIGNAHDIQYHLSQFSYPFVDLPMRGIEGLFDLNISERDKDFSGETFDSSRIDSLIKVDPETRVDTGFDVGFLSQRLLNNFESMNLSNEFDPTHSTVLAVLESRLRHLIEVTLFALAGPDWVNERISPDMRSRWNRRRQNDLCPGNEAYSLIQYADFMDLQKIVTHPDNWSEGFKDIFGNRDDFVISFQRMQPIRNSIAHSRPLGRYDAFTLIYEATRLLRAMGFQVLG